MLPAKNRLNSSLFRDKQKKGKIIDTGDLRIKILSSDGEFRLAVIISKKVVSKAVDRNKIKRKVTQALRQDLEKLSGNVIIIVKNNIASLALDEIKKKYLSEFIKIYDS